MNGQTSGLGHFVAVDPAHEQRSPAKINDVAERPKLHRIRRAVRAVTSSRPEPRRERVAELGESPAAVGVDWAKSASLMMGACVAVVAGAFALSYHGLFEFAAKLARLPWGLALVVPIGVDVYSICSLIATFLCQAAPWRVRAYCWLSFGFGVAISIGGNAVFAISQDPRMAAAWRPVLDAAPIVGAALWPALSASALHLLIITRRHVAIQRIQVEQAAEVAAEQAATDQILRARAIELVAAGGSCQDVADELGTASRNVQRWTQDLRAQLVAAKAPAAGPTRGRKS